MSDSEIDSILEINSNRTNNNNHLVLLNNANNRKGGRKYRSSSLRHHSENGVLFANGQFGEDNRLDDAILGIFEELEDMFHYPISSNRQARAFTKLLHVNKKLSYDSLGLSIGHRSKDVLSWQRGHSNDDLGKVMLLRINLPLMELLSEEEAGDWNGDVIDEECRRKSMKERRSRHSYRRRKGRYSSTPPPLNRNRHYRDSTDSAGSTRDRQKHYSVPDEMISANKDGRGAEGFHGNQARCKEYKERFGEHQPLSTRVGHVIEDRGQDLFNLPDEEDDCFTDQKRDGQVYKRGPRFVSSADKPCQATHSNKLDSSKVNGLPLSYTDNSNRMTRDPSPKSPMSPLHTHQDIVNSIAPSPRSSNPTPVDLNGHVYPAEYRNRLPAQHFSLARPDDSVFTDGQSIQVPIQAIQVLDDDRHISTNPNQTLFKEINPEVVMPIKKNRVSFEDETPKRESTNDEIEKLEEKYRQMSMNDQQNITKSLPISDYNNVNTEHLGTSNGFEGEENDFENNNGIFKIQDYYEPEKINYDSDFAGDINENTPLEQKTRIMMKQVKNAAKDGPGYVLIFSDDCDSGGMYRLKIGESRYPSKRLEQFQVVNIKMKMVSAVSVNFRKTAFGELKQALSSFSLPNRVDWYKGELSKILEILADVTTKFPIRNAMYLKKTKQTPSEESEA